MIIVALFLILGKKTQEFAFNVESDKLFITNGPVLHSPGWLQENRLWVVCSAPEQELSLWEAILTTPSDERFASMWNLALSPETWITVHVTGTRVWI